MRRFVINTLLFCLSIALFFVLSHLLIPWKYLQNDIARTKSLPFRYDPPQADTLLPRTPATDIGLSDAGLLPQGTICLFGDSYSDYSPRLWDDYRWFQYTGGQTGHRFASMHGNQNNPVNALYSTLIHYPDALSDTVVLELIERKFIHRLQEPGDEIGKTPRGLTQESQTTGDPKWKQQVTDFYRNLIINSPLPLPLHPSRVSDFYRNLIIKSPDVAHTPLTDSLLSSRPTMLYYAKEEKKRPTAEQIDIARQNLNMLDSLCASHGITLLLVVIPDKTHTYSHHLAEAMPPFVIDEEIIESMLPGRVCYPLKHFQAIVDAGTKDFYLPDDTHFSRIAAKELGLQAAHLFASKAQ